MKIKHIHNVAAAPVAIDGAKGASVRVIFGPADNAPTVAMRLFELEGGGHTPYHSHPFEHEVLVWKGQVALKTEAGITPLKNGDAVLVEPNEVHQFVNLSTTESAQFICLVPITYQK